MRIWERRVPFERTAPASDAGAYVSRMLGFYTKYQRQERDASQRTFIAALFKSRNSQHWHTRASRCDHA